MQKLLPSFGGLIYQLNISDSVSCFQDFFWFDFELSEQICAVHHVKVSDQLLLLLLWLD